jgi:micrococcal nuclease
MLALIISGLALANAVALDADTIRAGDWDYRLAGVDAPETVRAACPRERVLGEAAASRARALIAGAAVVEAIPADHRGDTPAFRRDRYGRRLARIELDGRDLGTLLIAEGRAVVWTPGVKHDWCG